MFITSVLYHERWETTETSNNRGRVKKSMVYTHAHWTMLAKILEQHGNTTKVIWEKQNRKVYIKNGLNYKNKNALKKDWKEL